MDVVNRAYPCAYRQSPDDRHRSRSMRVALGEAPRGVWHRDLRADRGSSSLFVGRLTGSMGHRTLVVFQGVLVSLLLAACASPPVRVLSSNAPLYATLPNGYEPLNPAQLSPIYAAVTTIPGDNLVRYLERKRGHALNLLSLSGGGQAPSVPASSWAGARADGGHRLMSSVLLAPVHC